jgi:GNAT superfamily N-acetyltransferase
MEFTIEPRPFGHPDAAALIGQVQDYYERIYGGHDADLMADDEFTPPDGLFLVGYLDGEPVACGGWRRRDARSVEIKRMYVAEPVRRAGLARVMLVELERRAAAAGVEQVVLNTGYRQSDAMRFYEANGYRPSDDRYGHYADIQGAFFFVKDLARPTRNDNSPPPLGRRAVE